MQELLLHPNPVQKRILDRHMETFKKSLSYAASAEQQYKQYVSKGLLPEQAELPVEMWSRLLNHFAYQNPLIEQLCPLMRKQFAWNIFWLQDFDFTVPRLLVPGKDNFMLWLEFYEPTQYYWNTRKHLYLPVVGFVNMTTFAARPAKLSTIILQITSNKTSVWYQ